MKNYYYLLRPLLLFLLWPILHSFADPFFTSVSREVIKYFEFLPRLDIFKPEDYMPKNDTTLYNPAAQLLHTGVFTLTYYHRVHALCQKIETFHIHPFLWVDGESRNKCGRRTNGTEYTADRVGHSGSSNLKCLHIQRLPISTITLSLGTVGSENIFKFEQQQSQHDEEDEQLPSTFSIPASSFSQNKMSFKCTINLQRSWNRRGKKELSYKEQPAAIIFVHDGIEIEYSIGTQLYTPLYIGYAVSDSHYWRKQKTLSIYLLRHPAQPDPKAT